MSRHIKFNEYDFSFQSNVISSTTPSHYKNFDVWLQEILSSKLPLSSHMTYYDDILSSHEVSR